MLPFKKRNSVQKKIVCLLLGVSVERTSGACRIYIDPKLKFFPAPRSEKKKKKKKNKNKNKKTTKKKRVIPNPSNHDKIRSPVAVGCGTAGACNTRSFRKKNHFTS